MSFIVAIDGPAGSGKGTITEKVSKELGLINIGSGAAYRCVALAMIRKGILLQESEKIIELTKQLKIEFRIEDGKDVIYLDDENVTELLMQREIAQIVSQVSSIKEVRYELNEIFRKCAINQDIIMEGRDIGTYVFPNANVKIYLDAKAEERAKRREKQNQEKGIQMSYEEILENIKIRDENDKKKEVGALKQAKDAIYIDSTNMTIEEVTSQMIEMIKEKRK